MKSSQPARGNFQAAAFSAASTGFPNGRNNFQAASVYGGIAGKGSRISVYQSGNSLLNGLVGYGT
jgi:hypothetical protein